MKARKVNKQTSYYDPHKFIVNSALPYSLQPYPPWRLFWHEIYYHHWALRIFSVSTGINWSMFWLRGVVALFMLSGVYDVLGNKVLQCNTRFSHDTCDGKELRFAGLLSMCRWDDTRSTCSSSIPSISANFLVTIIATILYSPFVSLLEWWISIVSGRDWRLKNTCVPVSSSSIQPSLDRSLPVEISIEDISKECEICTNIFYRCSTEDIEGSSLVHEYSQSTVRLTAITPLETKLVDEIKYVRKLALRELNDLTRFELDGTSSVVANRVRIHYLILRDLLAGSVAGDILDTLRRRDMPLGASTIQMSSLSPLLAAVLLAGTILGIIVYISVFLAQHPAAYQRSLGVSFAIWLTLDLFFTTPSVICIMHLLVPMSILSEVQIARALLVQHMKGAPPQIPKDSVTYPEDVAKFLVVSHRVADMLRSGPLSPHMDSNSYQRLQFPVSYRLKYYPYVLQQLKIGLTVKFMALLPSFQNSILTILCTILWGVVIIVHLWLYHINPLFVILSLFLVVLVVHFLVRSSAHKYRLEMKNGIGVDSGRKPIQQQIIPRGTSNVRKIANVVDFLMGNSTGDELTHRPVTKGSTSTSRLKNIISSRLLGRKAEEKEPGAEHSRNTNPESSDTGERIRRQIVSRVLNLGNGMTEVDISDNCSDEETADAGESGHRNGNGGWGWKSAMAALMTTPSLMGKVPQTVSVEELVVDEGHRPVVAHINTTPKSPPPGLKEDDDDAEALEVVQSKHSCESSQSTLLQEVDEDSESHLPESFDGVVDVLEMNMCSFLDIEESNIAFASSESDSESVRSGRCIEIRSRETVKSMPFDPADSYISFSNCEHRPHTFVMSMLGPLFVVTTNAHGYSSGESEDLNIADTHAKFDRICNA